MPDLTPEQVAQIQTPVRIEPVDVPAWGGTVYLRTPPSVRRDQIETSLWKDGVQDLSNFKAKLVACCICRADGRFWYDDPLAGAEVLGQKDSAVIKYLFGFANRLCPTEGPEIEALVKNSVLGPGSSGSSG